MRTIIFANGELTPQDLERAAPTADDTIIAADGGALHCRAYNIHPDALIGDFDSLPADVLERYEKQGVPVHRFPPDKDYTDLELALHMALRDSPDEVLILGGLGGRWDQSIANLLLPASTDCCGIQVRLIDNSQEVVVLRSGEHFTLHSHPGATVSLIPIGGDAQGITTEGLLYPLQSETLHFGATRGVSNEMLRSSAVISLENGFLLCVLIYSPQTKEGVQPS